MSQTHADRCCTDATLQLAAVGTNQPITSAYGHWRRRLSGWMLCTVLAGGLTIGPALVSAMTLRQTLNQLGDADAGKRFDAALVIIGEPRSDLAARISGGLKREPFRTLFGQSPEARAALDFVLLKLAGGTVAALPPSSPKRPNVILISVDTLRSDHVGAYGHQRDSTPTIDALAASGGLFSDAISSSSWTLPAHMSMFTSLYPSFHKLEKGGKLGSVRLDESEVTLAALMKRAGYTTAAMVVHPFLSAEWGFDRGFDLYRRYSSAAEAQTSRALLWLEWHQFHVNRGLREPNFFLFVHYIDPHEPYSPPPPYSQKYFPDYAGSLRPKDHLVTMFLEKPFETPEEFRYALSLYDGEINYVDAQLGRLLQTVRDLGGEGSTLVILTSDHGEEFKDHGSMGHKATLYEEQLQVPLIVSYPGVIAAKKKISTQVSLVDIMPTVLDFVGSVPYAKAQGVSLRPYLETPGSRASNSPDGRRYLFAELGPVSMGWERPFRRKVIRTNQRKLIFNFLPDDTLKKELYELDIDPGEQKNAYEAKRGVEEVRQLETRLVAFVREGLEYNKEFPTKNRIEIDEQTRERLRALGYLK